ncbi:Uncharacterised protein [Vibrio cholerae]|nr:Uncharacterised protein [Vibrio cholerae]
MACPLRSIGAAKINDKGTETARATRMSLFIQPFR